MIQGANKTISTYRLADGAGSDKTTDYNTTATLSGIEAYIESLRAELQIVMGIRPGVEVFNMYIEPADIRVGDKVVDQNSKVYYVQGIKRHEDNLDTDDLYEVQLTTQRQNYDD